MCCALHACMSKWGTKPDCYCCPVAAGRPALGSVAGAAQLTAQHLSLGNQVPDSPASAGRQGPRARLWARVHAHGQRILPRWEMEGAHLGAQVRCRSSRWSGQQWPAAPALGCCSLLMHCHANAVRATTLIAPAELHQRLQPLLLGHPVVSLCQTKLHLAWLSPPRIWLRKEALNVACPHHGAVLGSTSSLCLCGAHKSDVGKAHALRDATMV